MLWIVLVIVAVVVLVRAAIPRASDSCCDDDYGDIDAPDISSLTVATDSSLFF